MGIIRGLSVGIITENYQWELSPKVGIIGILAYEKKKKIFCKILLTPIMTYTKKILVLNH